MLILFWFRYNSKNIMNHDCQILKLIIEFSDIRNTLDIIKYYIEGQPTIIHINISNDGVSVKTKINFLFSWIWELLNFSPSCLKHILVHLIQKHSILIKRSKVKLITIEYIFSVLLIRPLIHLLEKNNMSNTITWIIINSWIKILLNYGFH